VGCVYRLKKSPFWWMKWIGVDGRPQYESSKTADHQQAKSMLAEREGAIAKGVPITSAAGRLTFKEAAADLLNEYKIKGRRTVQELELRLRLHLLPYFGRFRMVEINSALVRQYIQ